MFAIWTICNTSMVCETWKSLASGIYALLFRRTQCFHEALGGGFRRRSLYVRILFWRTITLCYNNRLAKLIQCQLRRVMLVEFLFNTRNSAYCMLLNTVHQNSELEVDEEVLNFCSDCNLHFVFLSASSPFVKKREWTTLYFVK